MSERTPERFETNFGYCEFVDGELRIHRANRTLLRRLVNGRRRLLLVALGCIVGISAIVLGQSGGFEQNAWNLVRGLSIIVGVPLLGGWIAMTRVRRNNARAPTEIPLDSIDTVSFGSVAWSDALIVRGELDGDEYKATIQYELANGGDSETTKQNAQQVLTAHGIDIQSSSQ